MVATRYTPNHYKLNATVQTYADFQDQASQPWDPATVTLNLRKPDGSSVTYTYGALDGVIIRTVAGSYYANIPSDQEGVWAYEWVATGQYPSASEGYWVVDQSRFA